MKQRHGTGLMAFSLVALFGLMCLLLGLTATGSYQKILENTKQNAQLRTGALYLTSKVRSCDSENFLQVQSVEGEPVLMMRTQGDMALYIYYSKGAVCEYTAPLESEFDAALGEKIVSASGFDVSIKDKLVCFTISNGQKTIQHKVATNCP